VEKKDIGDFVDWVKPEYGVSFMAQAFVISMRSIDPSTKHGCIVTDNENRPLSYGYNGPPRGCDDSKIPLTRPEKYKYMKHAEKNAILNAANTGNKLKDSIFYVTGHPCVDCLSDIINVGASKIIYGPVESHCITDEDREIMKFMLKNRDLIVVPFEGDVLSVLKKTMEYYKIKVLGEK